MRTELTPIDGTDRHKPRLEAALAIYRDTILKEAQTPEREIIFWIDHSREVLADEFRCFAIERDKKVIGYLQYSYYSEEHTFFFEYLCIRDAKRNGLVPNQALTAIANFLAENYRPNFTIVFEVAHRKKQLEDWKPDAKLISYFTRLGFRKAEFPYRYPVLQSLDVLASYPADLMVRLPYESRKISASQMRTILRCIHYKHYLRWDRAFLPADQFRIRERLIDELYLQQVARIAPDEEFPTTGDDNRSSRPVFLDRFPSLKRMLNRVFGTKLVRVLVLVALVLFLQWVLGSVLLLLPFALVVCIFYCLVDNSQESRKLLVVIISKLSRLQKSQGLHTL